MKRKRRYDKNSVRRYFEEDSKVQFRIPGIILKLWHTRSQGGPGFDSFFELYRINRLIIGYHRKSFIVSRHLHSCCDTRVMMADMLVIFCVIQRLIYIYPASTSFIG